ncbi:hypothetical protein R6Q57_021172 [Mikania cordata]
MYGPCCSTNEEGDLWPSMPKTGCLGQTAKFWPSMPKTGRLGQTASFCPGHRPAAAALRSRHTRAVAAPVAAVQSRICGNDEVPSDFADDWGVLANVGEAGRARAILGDDTPWTHLFEITELPTHRLITVEFLSMFRYRAHQAAVREQYDEELPPDIEFSLCGQHFEMSIERFVVHLGIYYEPETIRDDFRDL